VAEVPIPSLRSNLFAAVKNAFDRTSIVDRSRGILPGSPRLVQAGVRVKL
jgi:Fe(3+) dicitrate transport protein